MVGQSFKMTPIPRGTYTATVSVTGDGRHGLPDAAP
jgi:hypothetical protein